MELLKTKRTRMSATGILLCLSMLITALSPGHAFAGYSGTQQVGQQITGVIYDQQRLPLPGATIQEEGTSNATTSDLEGRFTMNVSTASPMLIVSFIGFSTQYV